MTQVGVWASVGVFINWHSQRGMIIIAVAPLNGNNGDTAKE